MDILNKIGRAALVTLVSALSLFATNLGQIPELGALETIIITSVVGLISLVVEYLRDQYGIQSKKLAYRANSVLQSVSIWSRVVRGLIVGAIAFITAFVGDLMEFLPEMNQLGQILFAALAGFLNMLVEWLRDQQDLSNQ